MECYICGEDIGGSLGMCPKCKANRESRRAGYVVSGAGGGEAVPSTGEYAGFWLRLFASVIDGFVSEFLLKSSILTVLSILSLAAPFARSESVAGSPLGIFAMIGFAGIAFTSLVTILFIFVLYGPLFESSRLMATPGKLLLGLRVGDVDRNRLTLFRALLRSMAKLLSAIPLGIGFIMAGVTRRKQALHDMVVSAVVFKDRPTSAKRLFIAFVILIAVVVVNGILAAHMKDNLEPRSGGYRTIAPAGSST